MAYAIRPWRDKDAEALAGIVATAIEVIGPHGYGHAQVAAWRARHPGPERFRERAATGDGIIVAAEADDRPVAYVLFESDGHIDHLYCHPDHTRQGLADELLAEAERRLREAGVTRLFTEASELARAAFERAGYEVERRRDFDLDGVPIHNFAMVKPLD